MSFQVNTIETDVLVIGGGLAGTNAAIGAAEKGARVVVMDKGKIERSGNIGGGVDHFLAYLNEGGDWDTRDAFLDYLWKTSRYMIDPSVVERVYCEELETAIKRMERIGSPLYRADGKFHRMQSGGQPGPYWINFDGQYLKPKLGKEVRRLGCTVLDRVMATGLLTYNGSVVGATGIHIRKGDFYIIKSKATVMSTGNTNRLFESPRNNTFNIWLCPNNTGDGQAMAFEAGAALTNMEFMRMSILPKGFGAPGFNALTGMGGRFMNGLGEYYMEKYHPLGNKAPRNECVFYMLQEIKAGRGPLYIDCRHLDKTVMDELEATLGYDKNTLPDYLKQRGEDIRTKPVEIYVSEGCQNGPTELCGSGIKIDPDSSSTVPGLFAGGDNCDSNRCVHGAVTGGYAAGKSAAVYSLRVKDVRINEDQVNEIKELVYAPLFREKGMSYKEFEAMLSKVMTENVGAVRHENSLKTALGKLGRAREYLSFIKANNLHELMRANECRSLLRISEIMTHAALFRKETRYRPYHHRLDYPDTNDSEWGGKVVVQKDGDDVKLSFLPVMYQPRTGGAK
ncbi:MAG: FAD-binding protein [Peptococcaceae bacterium]|nr:FAD-binding protein [Peptococcaceae bacterium]